MQPTDNFRFKTYPAKIQKLKQTDGGLNLVKDEVYTVFKGL